jgi:hypothetical protein
MAVVSLEVAVVTEALVALTSMITLAAMEAMEALAVMPVVIRVTVLEKPPETL